MNNKTTTGGEFNNSKPFKVFNEHYEIEVRMMVSTHLDKETRVDGEVAYVVKDLDALILDIMELHYEKK
jgi:hypothetical protein